eukprot:CAMPEP_0172367558 /NCGR_PEP_ID=MMETSP1060-20121228/22134_1 /TAXON_ID=37318 /ORGANISM="Pseudo-nitzschia pungens, Strain cf. cingulata" /LENGTH=347 /DNA_ID=CAMNT_0013091855 /DNA_START=61 /DNA_END=1104 /DNA_ORIENTATION=+
MIKQTLFSSLLVTLIVAPSLSFVPQSQRGCLARRFGRFDRKILSQLAAESSDDESGTATSDFPADNVSADKDENDTGAKAGKRSSVFSESVQEEAREVLEKVGWGGVAPDLTDPEQPMTSDDPFVKSIDAGIREDFGVGLDDLLNPAKVVNLERELYQLREELENTTDQDIIESITKSIEKKEGKLAIERRSVFRDWLKNIFVGQAVISFGLSYVMATNPSILFGGFDWYYYNSMDISIQVLGYWFWWLFIIPSLRSRRPRGFEKEALDIAFLGTPLVSLAAPVVTKDTGLIWIANFVVVAGAYGYAYLTDGADDDGDEDVSKKPAWLRFIYKSLDFGSGRERGARQ